MFTSVSFQQITDLKYCTLYGKKHDNSNATDIIRYICYSNEICCDRGNGCCPVRNNKYYDSWCFWIFVCGIVLACYLLCWYCKKLEKQRQSIRVNAGNDRNGTRMLPCLRPVDANNVDHVLETLILNYRSRLLNQQQPTQNLDGIKTVDNNIEPPPEYVDALKMPKPQTNLENSSLPSDDSMQNHASDESENSFVVDIDDQAIPSYEEAIKKM